MDKATISHGNGTVPLKAEREVCSFSNLVHVISHRWPRQRDMGARTFIFSYQFKHNNKLRLHASRFVISHAETCSCLFPL